MTALKFANYLIDSGADRDGQSHIWLICPQCPGTREYFADEIPGRVSIGELFTLANAHHNEHHREPHLEGNGQ